MENLPDIDCLLETRKDLDSISPSMCLAKWLQVSLHLTTGKTHSCYHPPAHSIDVNKIKENPTYLHNTVQKKKERRLMLKGKRPEGCSYCWNIEDCGNKYSDRHYRSSEYWAKEHLKDINLKDADENILPRYVEVNFNHACQFKCSYCSPHLSSSWMEEIKSSGAYPTIIPHNELQGLKRQGLYPISLEEENPYVEAFWKWWPKLYPSLRVFRMTGGEPLLDHNTFRVLDYIEEHPNPSLELSITTNLCPPQKMMDRFIEQVSRIVQKKCISKFMIFPSIDTWGPQAEYIRYGLNIKQFEQNVKILLEKCPELKMSFIITTTALSIFNLKKLLQKILTWNKDFYNGEDRVFFDITSLEFPHFQSLNILPNQMATSYLQDCLAFVKEHKYLKNERKYGFGVLEVDKVERLLSLVQNFKRQAVQKSRRIDFYRFFKEYDHRRNTNFLTTFPELKYFWELCKDLGNELSRQIWSLNVNQNLELSRVKNELDDISPTMCFAKWFRTSLYLTTGKTHSCHYTPIHNIDVDKIEENPAYLHNTIQKKSDRALMLKGERPLGCSHCWEVEDEKKYSSRHLFSFEEWTSGNPQHVNLRSEDILPGYMDVSFSNACQFKCSYCSPFHSSS
ncbi:MAG: twitch domain-containing radical SAM protein, partial [Halobacteriovoraceae bacterium]|nr:twitch domain-containing radical SAM protein [Halobacteriovoraceae bacterium]